MALAWIAVYVGRWLGDGTRIMSGIGEGYWTGCRFVGDGANTVGSLGPDQNDRDSHVRRDSSWTPTGGGHRSPSQLLFMLSPLRRPRFHPNPC
ncbi:hypothetical protein JAAARDRAFT_475617, partial [Jaapia argillacea MUCL 33604]